MRTIFKYTVLVLLAMLAFAPKVLAAGVPLGTEYRIITSTDGHKMALSNVGAVQVDIQDQWSDALFIKLHKHLGAGITLTSDASLNDTVLNVESGHGAVAGNLICLKEGIEYYQGTVLSTTATTITLDMPLDFAFTAGAYCSPTTDQMGVDGSGTDQEFHLQPNDGVKWDITQLNCIINGTGVMDSAQFGDITALTNGLVVRKQDGQDSAKNLFNIKNNADWSLRGNIFYDPKAPAGTSAVRINIKFGGQSESGVVIRLDGSLNQEFIIIVRDDASAVGIKCEVKGHRVVD